VCTVGGLLLSFHLLSSIVVPAAISTSCGSTPQAEEEELRETPLCDFHEQLGAQMVPYSGWKMPLQYSTSSTLVSHNHTRQQASLFDVSHMCQAQ
jgi:Aminomethyltransferase folate-binding domain